MSVAVGASYTNNDAKSAYFGKRVTVVRVFEPQQVATVELSEHRNISFAVAFERLG